MSHPSILRITTRASSCGCKVPTLSSSEKLKASQTSTLLLFGSGGKSSVNGQATDITLDGRELVLPEATRMTLIVLKGGLVKASL